MKVFLTPSGRFFKKGINYFKMNKFEDAVSCFKKALISNPKDEVSLLYLGLSLERLGERDEAEICFRKAIDLDEKIVSSHICLGLNFAEKWIDTNDKTFLKLAIEEYTKVNELNPDDLESKEFLSLLQKYENS